MPLTAPSSGTPQDLSRISGYSPIAGASVSGPSAAEVTKALTTLSELQASQLSSAQSMSEGSVRPSDDASVVSESISTFITWKSGSDTGPSYTTVITRCTHHQATDNDTGSDNLINTSTLTSGLDHEELGDIDENNESPESSEEEASKESRSTASGRSGNRASEVRHTPALNRSLQLANLRGTARNPIPLNNNHLPSHLKVAGTYIDKNRLTCVKYQSNEGKFYYSPPIANPALRAASPATTAAPITPRSTASDRPPPSLNREEMTQPSPPSKGFLRSLLAETIVGPLAVFCLELVKNTFLPLFFADQLLRDKFWDPMSIYQDQPDDKPTPTNRTAARAAISSSAPVSTRAPEHARATEHPQPRIGTKENPVVIDMPGGMPPEGFFKTIGKSIERDGKRYAIIEGTGPFSGNFYAVEKPNLYNAPIIRSSEVRSTAAGTEEDPIMGSLPHSGLRVWSEYRNIDGKSHYVCKGGAPYEGKYYAVPADEVGTARIAPFQPYSSTASAENIPEATSKSIEPDDESSKQSTRVKRPPAPTKPLPPTPNQTTETPTAEEPKPRTEVIEPPTKSTPLHSTPAQTTETPATEEPQPRTEVIKPSTKSTPSGTKNETVAGTKEDPIMGSLPHSGLRVWSELRDIDGKSHYVCKGGAPYEGKYYAVPADEVDTARIAPFQPYSSTASAENIPEATSKSIEPDDESSKQPTRVKRPPTPNQTTEPPTAEEPKPRTEAIPSDITSETASTSPRTKAGQLGKLSELPSFYQKPAPLGQAKGTYLPYVENLPPDSQLQSRVTNSSGMQLDLYRAPDGKFYSVRSATLDNGQQPDVPVILAKHPEGGKIFNIGENKLINNVPHNIYTIETEKGERYYAIPVNRDTKNTAAPVILPAVTVPLDLPQPEATSLGSVPTSKPISTGVNIAENLIPTAESSPDVLPTRPSGPRDIQELTPPKKIDVPTPPSASVPLQSTNERVALDYPNRSAADFTPDELNALSTSDLLNKTSQFSKLELNTETASRNLDYQNAIANRISTLQDQIDALPKNEGPSKTQGKLLELQLGKLFDLRERLEAQNSTYQISPSVIGEPPDEPHPALPTEAETSPILPAVTAAVDLPQIQAESLGPVPAQDITPTAEASPDLPPTEPEVSAAPKPTKPAHDPDLIRGLLARRGAISGVPSDEDTSTETVPQDQTEIQTPITPEESISPDISSAITSEQPSIIPKAPAAPKLSVQQEIAPAPDKGLAQQLTEAASALKSAPKTEAKKSEPKKPSIFESMSRRIPQADDESPKPESTPPPSSDTPAA